MRSRGWIAFALLTPLAVVIIGTQLALVTGIVGLTQSALAGRARDSVGLERGITTVQVAAGILDRTWSSPAATLLEWNPMTLGAIDDLAGSAHALAVGTEVLDPLAEIAGTTLGFDGAPPMVSGSTIDPVRVEELTEPFRQVHASLARTEVALAEVAGSGPLGQPIGAIARSAQGAVGDLTAVAAAVDTAMPDLAEALGSGSTQRYLVTALNDAELFASGGAPLSAFMVQADRGELSVPISGQLESKLSPDNPPIQWEKAGGLPWYRTDKRYPFVNSNFHPDFRTASVDMRRAWAALGYPEVDGVITVDINALASVLAWTGGLETDGFGEITSDNLIGTVLVDAYRQFNSPEGTLERHARNDELSASLTTHLIRPLNLVAAIRGALRAIPARHLQASFDAPALQAAVDGLAAQGALSDEPGDLIGVFSQSAPNKLSVFQDRSIHQEVDLDTSGGATVRRTVTFTNAVPPGLEGDTSTYRGYLALRARARVAHRLPLPATATRIQTRNSLAAVPVDGPGPFPDDRGGMVLWEGYETAPGDATTVVVEYSLPAGTFPRGTYSVSADPQALTLPTDLTIRVTPADGGSLPQSPGWTAEDGALVWEGLLDRPLQLSVG